MAPQKRNRSDGESTLVTVKVTVEKSPPSRVTRSSTRRLNGDSVADPPAAKSEAGLTKSKKKAKPTPKKEVKEEEAPPARKVAVSETKTIVIEHCKQCNRFKTRAAKVKEALEKEFSGISILVNPEKPRRGCFEVREEGGEKFITLLDLKRPFVPLTDLDMDEVIADIIGKIKQ